MKTNLKTNGNRIQETILKSFIVAAIVIISASVSAQNFWASNDGNYSHLMRLIAAGNKAETVALKTTGFEAFNHKEAEEMLVLEEWMTSENYFGMYTEIRKESDNPLELEDWMTKEANFHVKTSESDHALQLESWMTNELHFTDAQDILNAEEKPLKLEAWMLNESNFEICSNR